MSTLFDFLPIGAYQSSESGRMLRANQALVHINGYDTQAELLNSVNDIGLEWYVDPTRRETFKQLMFHAGRVVDFVSEIYRHKTRERIWIRENAHVVRDAQGQVQYFEGTVEDVTESHANRMALQSSEEQFREMASEVPGMLYQIRFEPGQPGRYTFISSGVRALHGVEPEAILADSMVLRSMRHPEDRDRVALAVQNAVAKRAPLALEFRIILPDGRVRWVQMASTHASENDQAIIRNGILIDITDRKLAEAELQNTEARWKLALESTGDGVWDWYVQTGEEFFSRRCKEIYGYSAHELEDQSLALDDRTHPDDVPQMLLDRETHFKGLTPSYANEHRILCKNGTWKWVLTRGMVISRDESGRPLRMIGTHTDISERKATEQLVWQQAHFDSLTGLPNRRMLRERLQEAIRQSQQSATTMAILFIDLDHFKEVNDTLGHDMGDLLLIEAARRISSCVQESDTVARMGGDEFTVILNDAHSKQALVERLECMLQRLARAFVLEGEQVFVSASIGVAVYPDDASLVEDLFKHADQALYVAKGAGRNQFSFFTPELQDAALTRLRLAADLRGALEKNQFEVVYQPIVDLSTTTVRKAEALLRWHHPQRGLVSPAQFIPIAESNGLIISIGDWVFQQAARQTLQWRKSYRPDFQISVNKSPVQFHQPVSQRQAWIDYLHELGLPGNSIAVEITEGVLLDATESVGQQLIGLRESGLAVSLDDFGTGYSSLTYLQRFAIDSIKIDQSFVRNLYAGSTDLALCKAIVTMSHELGMTVVAEGVETQAQRDLLISVGCDYGQGYLFSRPLGVADFEAFYEKHRKEHH
jgi:diguanylate cyclase (GGDEF)-like protein/PAS domain S-box-containing protein